MVSYVLPRVLHVLAIVLRIGSVAFVTTVLLPGVRRMRSPEERVVSFEEIEGRLAWQARGTTLLAGATGFYWLLAP